jgi:hypothetical protein
MKTNLLLDNETRAANLMLQNTAPTKMIVREAVAGCNCDRWGHPCPGCDERKVHPKAELTISSPAKQTS